MTTAAQAFPTQDILRALSTLYNSNDGQFTIYRVQSPILNLVDTRRLLFSSRILHGLRTSQSID